VGFGGSAVAAERADGLHAVDLGTGVVSPYGVVLAADGTPWFLGYGDDQSGIYLTTEKGLQKLHLSNGTFGEDLWGPDGGLWAIDLDTSGISRTTVDGSITRYLRLWGPGPDRDGIVTGPWPERIITGPDGAMWFGDQRRNRIMSVRADGVTRVIARLSRRTLPELLITGPDGSVWYTATSGGLGRILPDGRVDAIRYPKSAIPAAAVASTGEVWFIRLVTADDELDPSGGA
jgi:virginiamycin B lyase